MLAVLLGGLGCGKTLGMTYLAIKSYFVYQRKIPIYANYHLYGIPFTFIRSPEDIERMATGIFAGDELWLWLDSRASSSKRNKLIAKILAKSRKRNVEIFYTAQYYPQIDVRIRRITDLKIYPSLNKQETVCTLRICDRYDILKKIIRFRTAPIFDMYDTAEEVEEIEGDLT